METLTGIKWLQTKLWLTETKDNDGIPGKTTTGKIIEKLATLATTPAVPESADNTAPNRVEKAETKIIMVGKEKVEIPTREPDGKKDDASAIWWDSPDGKSDIMISYEADKKTVSMISKWRYDKDTGKMVEGERIISDGNKSKGKFDKDTGNLIEWTYTYKDGAVEIGKFDKDTGNLIEWTYTYKNGVVAKGKYDKDTGKLTEWTYTYKNGVVAKGKYDKDTGKLTEWTYTYKNGTVENGIFDKTSGDLITGTKKTPDGKVTQYKDGKVVETSPAPAAAAPAAPAASVSAASVSEKVTTTDILSNKEFRLLSSLKQEEKLKKIVDEQIRIIDTISTEQGLLDMDTTSGKIQKMVWVDHTPEKLQTLLDLFTKRLEEKRVDMRNTQREPTITRLQISTK